MTFTRRQRLLAYAMGGVGPGSNTLIFFLVPIRASELGVNLGLIGVLLGLKALTETALAVPLGSFIDRVGAKRAYLIGTIGMVAAGAGFMVASSVLALFLLQVVLGATRPLAWVGGQSYVSGMRSGADRSYDTGRFSFAANLGQILTPLLAGLAVQVWGARLAFLVLAVYGLAFFLVAVTLPDSGREGADAGAGGAGFRRAAALLRLSDIQVVMLLTFTRLWVPSVWTAFLPLYLVSVGTSAGIAGTAVSSMAVAATVTSLLTGRIAKLGRPSVLTAVALGISCVGVALTPLATGVPAVFAPAAMVGFGQGLSLPLLLVLVSAAAPKGQRSLALGLRSGVNQAAATAAPVLIAPIITLGGLGVGFAVAGGVGAAFLAAAMAIDHLGRRSSAARQDPD